MANTPFAYTKLFEPPDTLPLSNFIVVRIDGRGFSTLCKKFSLHKPNDARLIALMNFSAERVVAAFPDIVCAYGQSDEYSFVFREEMTLWERRAAKVATGVVSAFTAEFVLGWSDERFFGGGRQGEEGAGGQGRGKVELTRPYPTFDGRCVCYPKRKILRDYLAWRQADCHVNNLYNTTFWNLVLRGSSSSQDDQEGGGEEVGKEKKGMSGTEAELMLKGTLAKDKNEILWSRFGINYNDEEAVWRKGTVIYRAYDDGGDDEGKLKKEKEKKEKEKKEKEKKEKSRTQLEKEKKRRMKARIVVEHTDIIGDAFWEKRPYILGTGE